MGPTTINIAVLHAQEPLCEALCDFIADEVGFRVIGGSGSAPAAVELLRNATTHVLVVDLASVGDGATQLLLAVREASPGTSVLLMVQDQPTGELAELMARGAGGYLATARASADLPAALRTIGMGRRYRPSAEVGVA
jgi:DNA-binding NarL/FixJ family response regulator